MTRSKVLKGGADSYFPLPYNREVLLAYVKSGLRIKKLINRLKEEILIRSRVEQEQRLIRQRDMLIKDLHDGIGGITANISILSDTGEKGRHPR